MEILNQIITTRSDTKSKIRTRSDTRYKIMNHNKVGYKIQNQIITTRSDNNNGAQERFDEVVNFPILYLDFYFYNLLTKMEVDGELVSFQQKERGSVQIAHLCPHHYNVDL